MNSFCKILCSTFFIINSIYPSTSRGQIQFAEKSTDYNVTHNMGGSHIGGGISTYDFNQDGLDDLTLASHDGSPIAFYVNNGNNGFDLIDPLVDNTQRTKQIIWVDYDNDGDPDLYVAANDGINRFYRNNGNLELEDITEESGLPLNTHFGYGAVWGDYNRDGWLDLYYVSKGVIGDPTAIRSYNRLFRNDANGLFTEQTEEANVADDGKLPFCAAFIDYNNDMWPDIYIANDKLTFNTLLENNMQGKFNDVSLQTGSNARMNAMCVTPGDFNRDGWIDVYVTNTPVGSQYLVNSGEPNFSGFIQYENLAPEIGIAFEGGNCWGSNFLDADNDSDLDLYISSSIPTPQDVSSAFYENLNGEQFQDPLVPGFMSDTTESYSNAVGDINNDGLMDLIVQNNPPANFTIWENQTPGANNWIKIDLEGVMSNRDGIGARIELFAGGQFQMHFTTCGSAFLGQNSSKKHFGIGSNQQVDSVFITWPTGHVDTYYDLEPNQVVSIVEGSSTNGEILLAAGINIKPWEEIVTSVGNDQNNNISIFPNPGSNSITIQSPTTIDQVKLLDAKGRVVFEEQNGALGRKIIGTGHLKPGMYLVEITFHDKSTSQYKWIKN